MNQVSASSAYSNVVMCLIAGFQEYHMRTYKFIISDQHVDCLKSYVSVHYTQGQMSSSQEASSLTYFSDQNYTITYPPFYNEAKQSQSLVLLLMICRHNLILISFLHY